MLYTFLKYRVSSMMVSCEDNRIDRLGDSVLSPDTYMTTVIL